jgi:hypothetical protein
MNLQIKNTLKTLKNTRQQVAETVAQVDSLRLATDEAATAASSLSNLRLQREDLIAASMASNQPTETKGLDDRITGATANHALLFDKAAASGKATLIVEKNLANLRAMEAEQLDAVFSAYFHRFHAAERLALEKTAKALADFKEAAAQLATTHEACSILNRGGYKDWQDVQGILYSRFENNQTLRDLTKERTEELLKTIDAELVESLGLTIWQVKTKHPRRAVKQTEQAPAPESA